MAAEEKTAEEETADGGLQSAVHDSRGEDGGPSLRATVEAALAVVEQLPPAHNNVHFAAIAKLASTLGFRRSARKPYKERRDMIPWATCGKFTASACPRALTTHGQIIVWAVMQMLEGDDAALANCLEDNAANHNGQQAAYSAKRKKYRNAERLEARYEPFTAAEEEQAEDDEAVVLDGIAAFTKMREELTVRTAAVGPSADGSAGRDFEDGFEVGALSFRDPAVGEAYEEFGKRMLEHLKTGNAEDDPAMFSRYASNQRARVVFCTVRNPDRVIQTRRLRRLTELLQFFGAADVLTTYLLTLHGSCLIRLVLLVYIGGTGGHIHRDPSEYFVVSSMSRRLLAGLVSLRIASCVATDVEGGGRALSFFRAGKSGDSGARTDLAPDVAGKPVFSIARALPRHCILMLVTLYSAVSDLAHQAVPGVGGHVSDILTVREPPPHPPASQAQAGAVTAAPASSLNVLADRAGGGLLGMGLVFTASAKATRVAR